LTQLKSGFPLDYANSVMWGNYLSVKLPGIRAETVPVIGIGKIRIFTFRMDPEGKPGC
jgi:hypothetical protein